MNDFQGGMREPQSSGRQMLVEHDGWAINIHKIKGNEGGLGGANKQVVVFSLQA